MASRKKNSIAKRAYNPSADWGIPLPTPNMHLVEMDSIGQGVLPEIDGSQNLRWLPWRPYWKSERAENRNEPSPTHPQHAQSKWIRLAKAFSPKWTETKFTMAAVAAILKIGDRQKSKGTFPYPPPTCTVEMDSIGQGVLPEIDGNQIYDGCRGGHIENQESAENRKEPSPTHPNMHSRNGFDRPRRSSRNRRKPITGRTDAPRRPDGRTDVTDRRTSHVTTIPLMPI
jgi:hypothetical protein